jgi:hypothetical protein
LSPERADSNQQKIIIITEMLSLPFSLSLRMIRLELATHYGLADVEEEEIALKLPPLGELLYCSSTPYCTVLHLLFCCFHTGQKNTFSTQLPFSSPFLLTHTNTYTNTPIHIQLNKDGRPPLRLVVIITTSHKTFKTFKTLAMTRLRIAKDQSRGTKKKKRVRERTRGIKRASKRGKE